jgi:hypothetical protein
MICDMLNLVVYYVMIYIMVLIWKLPNISTIPVMWDHNQTSQISHPLLGSYQGSSYQGNVWGKSHMAVVKRRQLDQWLSCKVVEAPMFFFLASPARCGRRLKGYGHLSYFLIFSICYIYIFLFHFYVS